MNGLPVRSSVSSAIGQGVPQDYGKAAKWYQRAGSQSDTFAQGSLGFMYLSGEGVPQDDVLAHMRFNLAAAQDNKDYAKTRDQIASLLTPDQLAEAQRLARDWKPTPER